MHSALTAVAVLCALLALAGAAYFAMCIVAAKRFQRERSRLPVWRYALHSSGQHPEVAEGA